MLINLGILWVILGHSERRALLGESNGVLSMSHLMQHVFCVIFIVVAIRAHFYLGLCCIYFNSSLGHQPII
jgi:hypothetical protein